MTRREVLNISSSMIICAPLAGMLKACVSPVPIIHVRRVAEKVILNAADLGDLSVPGSYAKVYVEPHANPVLVFQEGEEMQAILSTCSHSGCEVKKLRTKFECPCHGSEYDLEGRVVRGPAPEPLQRFPVVRTLTGIEIIMKG